VVDALRQNAPDNPWGAAGLEWQTSSPPTTFNFEHEPVVTWEAYNYERTSFTAARTSEISPPPANQSTLPSAAPTPPF
jgi:heme/copper-type cytochrome/quinol oxidase subunit 1